MVIEGLTIIAERINYTVPSIGPLLEAADKSGDFSEVQKVARREKEKGAHYIDVNIGPLSAEMMAKTVRAIQQAVDLPLCIDSSDPATLAYGLDAYDINRANGRLPILNSATERRAEEVFSLRKNQDCKVVLLVSEGGSLIGEEAYKTAKQLFHKALGYGFQQSNIYIDPGLFPLIYDVGEKGAINMTLDAIKKIHSDPATQHAHTLVGLTNIVRDAPEKRAVLPLQNAFLTLAMEEGLDTIVGNPLLNYQKLEINDPALVGLKMVVEAKDSDERCIHICKLYRTFKQS